MSLATVLERSRHEKESWQYTNIEEFLNRLETRKRPPVPLTRSPTKRGIGLRQETLTSPICVGEEVRWGTLIQNPCLTFIDGVWQQTQSRRGNLPTDILSGDADAGYKLALAGQTCLVTQPVELLFITTNTSPREMTTRLNIELGQSGRLTLIERHLADDDNVTAAHILETSVLLHSQAKLVHVKILQNAPAAHLAMTKIEIAEGAYYDNFSFIKNSLFVRNEIEARLVGKLAQCKLHGLMLLRNHEHADTTTRIIHAAPHSTSREVYKSVVDGQARGVFQGKIIVDEDAQKTDGYQLSQALLLSDQAEMDSKPELEIYADDVKCSHGSTVGDLDTDALFYLRTRGLSGPEARALLLRAFIDEIINEVHAAEWHDIVRAEADEWLGI
jgi:Fe-S cluster assembly protein SufD